MSLVPARHNLTAYRGATFYTRITLEVENKLQDLTGYRAKLVVKEDSCGLPFLTLDSEIEGIELGGETGTIDIEIEDSVTQNLAWSSGIYELIIIDGSGRTDILSRGGFKIISF